MFKDYLVACDTRAGFAASLSLGLKFASSGTGHVTACQLIVEEIEPAATAAVTTPVAVAPAIHRDEEAITQLRRRASELRSEIGKRADAANVSVDWHREEGAVDLLAARTMALARVHDVSILDGPQSDDETEWTTFLERMVRECGRPCLVVPHAYDCDRFGENIQINWDGSRSAARAVHDALPLLKHAGSVSIVEKGSQPDQEGCSGEKLDAHLQRHGVNAAVHKLSSTDEPVAQTLADHANSEGCDLIVMGAYSQSWLRRFVLGSVTDKTIQNLQIPVFTAH